jgi:hypothetical protein
MGSNTNGKKKSHPMRSSGQKSPMSIIILYITVRICSKSRTSNSSSHERRRTHRPWSPLLLPSVTVLCCLLATASTCFTQFFQSPHAVATNASAVHNSQHQQHIMAKKRLLSMPHATLFLDSRGEPRTTAHIALPVADAAAAAGAFILWCRIDVDVCRRP